MRALSEAVQPAPTRMMAGCVHIIMFGINQCVLYHGVAIVGSFLLVRRRPSDICPPHCGSMVSERRSCCAPHPFNNTHAVLYDPSHHIWRARFCPIQFLAPLSISRCTCPPNSKYTPLIPMPTPLWPAHFTNDSSSANASLCSNVTQLGVAAQLF